MSKLNVTVQELNSETSLNRLAHKEFAVMDLLLISFSEVLFPLRSSAFKMGTYMLGLIISVSRSEGGLTVAVDLDKWLQFKQLAGSRKCVISGAKFEGSVSGLYYATVDGLTSSWREFMSLHQVGIGIGLKLLTCVSAVHPLPICTSIKLFACLFLNQVWIACKRLFFFLLAFV